MKKLLSIVSAAALCAALIPASYAANGEGYSTDFSGLQTGGAGLDRWTFNGEEAPWFTGADTSFCEDNNTSIVAENKDGNTYLCLNSTGEGVDTYAGAIFDSGITGGVYKIAFDQKSESDTATNDNKCTNMRVRFTDGTNTKEVLYLSENSGDILNAAGNAAIAVNQAGDTVRLSKDTWSRVELIVNLNTRQVMRFINGRGAQSVDILSLDGVSKILIAGSTDDLYIDNFEVKKLDNESAYAESEKTANELINTNFTRYVDYAFNQTNEGQELVLGNASWRGCAYTSLTDRGVSMKLTEERQANYSTTSAKELTFALPNAVTSGVYAAELWIKPEDKETMPELTIKLKGKYNGSDNDKDAVKTDTSGKVVAPNDTKDNTGADLKLKKNEWNKIEVVYNMDNDTIYSFVNGFGIGSVSWGANEFSSLFVSASAVDTDIYIDDLRVYKEDASLYSQSGDGSYIEYEDFTAAGTKVSDASSADIMKFGNFTFGNAAWRGSTYAAKTDKGISLCMGDPTGNTLANNYNDVTWALTDPLSDTDGKYVIEFDQRYDTEKTCKFTVQLNGDSKNQFVASSDGYIVGGNNAANFESDKWNHAEIIVDLSAKKVSFYINDTFVKESSLNNAALTKILLQSAAAGDSSSGDIFIDNFTVKKITETEPVFNSKITTFSKFISDTDKAMGYLAEVTSKTGGSITNIEWTVTQGKTTKTKDVTLASVEIPANGSVYFGLIADGLYDNPDIETDNASCELAIN